MGISLKIIGAMKAPLVDTQHLTVCCKTSCWLLLCTTSITHCVWLLSMFSSVPYRTTMGDNESEYRVVECFASWCRLTCWSLKWLYVVAPHWGTSFLTSLRGIEFHIMTHFIRWKDDHSQWESLWNLLAAQVRTYVEIFFCVSTDHWTISKW